MPRQPNGTPHVCVEQARQVGVATGALVQALLEPYLLARLREAQALLRLRDRYPDERLERACRRALDEGDGRVRTVRGILERGLDEGVSEAAPEARATVAFLRGAAAFASAPEREGEGVAAWSR